MADGVFLDYDVVKFTLKHWMIISQVILDKLVQVMGIHLIVHVVHGETPHFFCPTI